MLDQKRPIFQGITKPAAIPAQTKTAALTQPKVTPEAAEDVWLHEYKKKGRLRVKFVDGEVLEGVVSKVRKYSFALRTDAGSFLVYKLQLKYI
jgi:sRNA-binding regulator protein Hfq